MFTDKISQSPKAAEDKRQGSKVGAKAKIPPDTWSEKPPDSSVGMELPGLAGS